MLSLFLFFNVCFLGNLISKKSSIKHLFFLSTTNAVIQLELQSKRERGKILFPDSGSTCQSKIVPKKQKLIGFASSKCCCF